MRNRIVYLTAGVCGFLFLGISYAWGIFVVPLETSFGYTRSQTSLVLSVCLALFSLGVICAGLLGRRFSSAKILMIAACLVGMGLILTGFSGSLWQIFLTYSILCGTGIGIGYNCIVSTVPLWFPEKGGTVTGILVMGYALSSAVFGPMISLIIGAFGVSQAFRIVGLVSLTGLFLVSFFMKKPTQEDQEKLPTATGKQMVSTREIETGKMVRLPFFWVYFAVVVLIGGIGLSIINHASPILSEVMKAGTIATLIVSINAIVNGCSRLVFGIVYDRIGFRKTRSIVDVIGALGTILAFAGVAGSSIPVFVAGSCVCMAAFGGNATICPAITRTVFGNEYFPMNYSVVNLNAFFAALFPTLIGSIQTISGGYTVPMMVLVGIGVLTLIGTVLFHPLYKKIDSMLG